MNEGKFVKLRKNLEYLECPLLGNGEDWWMKEILITSEQYKQELLIFLLSKIDENLQKALKEEIKNSFSDGLKTKLINNALASLGLQKWDESGFLGSPPTFRQQILFWEQLTDLIVLQEQRTKTASNQMKHFDQHYKNNQAFLKEIAQQTKISKLFNTEISLLPPDITKEIKKPPAKKKVKNFKDDLQILEEDLAKVNQHLSNLQKDILKTEKNCENSEEKLKLSLQQFYQSISEFKDCYNCLKPWFEKSVPELVEFGNKFPIMYELLNHWTNFNEMLTVIIQSSSNLKQSKLDLKQNKNRTFTDQISELNNLLQYVNKGLQMNTKSYLEY
ncbi:uncharacterized protein LOC111624730 [Centruroides sculpturatus]|uniref:uncharacterized protein LOC111624730 n=1 Tax=Centruroides sculpturatus TaxID=218467 RepID=UPI000C6CA7F9|nr:uncharacterized protein LOC111624730 [Centruroides sculpturatus]XP_023223423.1 uncharacterized protein LOC111624730 [Centruroides sculpturatus]